MTSKIRFYLDENIPNVIAEGLRTRDIDVLTTPEAEHRGMSDPDHLAFALSDQRVFVTQDDDFLVLAGKGIEHAGVVYYKPQTRSEKEIIRRLFEIYDKDTAEGMMNMVRFV